MLVEPSDRLVERDLRQRASLDIAKEVITVLQMFRAISRAGCEACIIVEGLIVRLKVGTAVAARVDNAALLLDGASTVHEREVPPAGIPGPADALGGQGITNGLCSLRRQRLVPAVVPCGISQIETAVRCGRHAARLIGRLRRID